MLKGVKVLSQRHFPKGDFSSDNFPIGNFPLEPRLEQAGGRALQLGSLGKLPLGKLHIWEVSTWENTLKKLPLGKNPVGKCLT